MNQIITGKFIAKKRRELNLTQEQLGEKLSVSNKSVSKWETGKCMPDYSVIAPLCQELGISISELLDGEENERENIRLYDDNQMLNMVERVQRLEKQKHLLIGIMLVTLGVAMQALSGTISGTGFKDFISGIMLGLSIGEVLAGVFIVVRSFVK